MLFFDLTRDRATYNWPWEKIGDAKFRPTKSSVWPWDLFITFANFVAKVMLWSLCIYLFITFANFVAKVMFWSLCIYLFIYLFIYLWICVFVCYSQNSKSIELNRSKFGGMIGYYPRTIWLDFGSDRVKGQGQVMKRSKSSFYHSAVNLYPICMQLMPKCSEFNAPSCDMWHDTMT